MLDVQCSMLVVGCWRQYCGGARLRRALAFSLMLSANSANDAIFENPGSAAGVLFAASRRKSHWMFNVRCWLLDVRCSPFDVRRSTLNAQRSTFNWLSTGTIDTWPRPKSPNPRPELTRPADSL